MARCLVDAGYREVYCTPHLIRGGFEASNENVLSRLADTQALFDGSGVPIRLHPGREYYLDEYLLDYLADPLPLGDSRNLLIELPHRIAGEDMVRQILFRVVSAGFTPVIAHPERSPALEVSRSGQRQRAGILGRLFRSGRTGDGETFTLSRLLEYLRELGCRFQGNIGSLSGYYGERVRRQAEAMRAMGLYDRMGTDLHSADTGDILRGSAQGAAPV
jgi:protein-tyrosine phosphatase